MAQKFDHSEFDPTQPHLPENCIVCQDKILHELVAEQQRDEALWAHPEIISEAYMQAALIKLHTSVKRYLELIDVLDSDE